VPRPCACLQRVRFDSSQKGGLRGWVSASTSAGEPAFQEDIEAALRHSLEVGRATLARSKATSARYAAHTERINVEEAQRNFESSVVEMDAGRYDAAPFGWNLAICECAPLAAQPQQNTTLWGTPRTGAAKVLNDAVLYQLLPSSQRNRIRLR